jgi:hypothetical protein
VFYKIFLVAVFSVVSLAAYSQESVLFEACKALVEAERRAACFEELVKKGASTSLPTKFAAASKALIKIQSGVSVGVSQGDYSRLLQDLVAEVAIAKEQLKTEHDAAVFSQFAVVIETYRDGVDFWEKFNKFMSLAGNARLYNGAIPLYEIPYFENKYSFQSVGLGWGKAIRAALKPSVLQAIWNIAQNDATKLAEIIAKKAD